MSRTKQLHVLLDDREAGIIREDPSGRYVFDYADDYADDPGTTPLSLSMPKRGRSFTDRIVRPFIDGLLPDNDTVREGWARQAQVSARNPFSLLTAYGEDCAGAARLVRPDRLDHDVGEGIDWLTLGDVATIVEALRNEPDTWQQPGPLANGHFSLAGAQPKVALHRRGERWGRPFGRTPTTHILKVGFASIADHDIVEHLCLRACRAVGLPTAMSTIEEFGGHRVMVVERFDRLTDGDVTRRVHTEDICQALSVPPRNKYESNGGPTSRAIVDLLRQSVNPYSEAEKDVDHFVGAMALNWLIVGTDAHAKNYSLLLSSTAVRLAPLYDVISVLCNSLAPRDRRLAMKIGGDFGPTALRRRHWERAAAQWSVDPGRVFGIIEQIADRLPDAIADAANDLIATFGATPIATQLVTAITQQVQICRTALRG